PYTAPLRCASLSLHDALPIFSRHLGAIASPRRFHPSVDRTPSSKRLRTRTRTRPTPPPARRQRRWALPPALPLRTAFCDCHPQRDRKSTRLNSSHQIISYAVF